MNKRWGYWTFWVGVSAIASFVWGLQIANKSFWPSVGGMLAGIGCFIVFIRCLMILRIKISGISLSPLYKKASI